MDIQKARIMLWSSLTMTVASVGITATMTWRVSQFVSHERDLQSDRLAALRDEMAEIGDAVSIQASQMTALREHLTLQLDFISKEQTRLREDMVRQEGATAAALRDLKADIRESRTKDG